MNKVLVIGACLGFLLLAGCNRCDMWGWYNECDLIEGRAERECRPCPTPCYQPGQVVHREWAVPADACGPCVAPAPQTSVVVVDTPAPLPPPAVMPATP